MGLATNITRRTGSKNYYVRITVPVDLVTKLKKSEIWRSLRTSNPAEAKRLSRPVLDRYEREFRRLQSLHSLTDEQLQTAIWNRYSTLVQQDRQRRIEQPTDDDLDAIWKTLVAEYGDPQNLEAWRILEMIASAHEENRQQRTARLRELRADLAKGETKSVTPVVAEVVSEKRLNVPLNSPDERKLAHFLQRAEIEALKRAAEHDLGEFGGQISDGDIKPPTPTSPAVAAPGETIMELFDVFARDNPNKATRETLEQSRTVVSLFAQFVGAHVPASAITKKEVREWKAALREYPVKATEMATFRNMDFRRTVESNRKLKKPTISDKTLNRYLAALGSFCKWLVAHGYLNDIPTSGMFVKIDKSEQKVHSYSTEQLLSIFGSPLFTGCMSEQKIHKPGNLQICDHRYWVPLLSLFTGARLGELCQLTASDVETLDGYWVLHITNEDEGQRLKTKGSRRIVPLHRELIELGFLQYLEQVNASNEKWLFPDIQPDSRGSRSGRMSNFYRKYLKKIGVKIDKSINFHSFRHSFADALRRAGHLDHQFAFLLGHTTQNNVTGRYGLLQEGDLVRRVHLVDSVAYPDLNLAHLYSPTRLK